MASDLLKDVSVERMREAAEAWKGASGPAVSIHDRVEELIDEIERLRAILASK